MLWRATSRVQIVEVNCVFLMKKSSKYYFFSYTFRTSGHGANCAVALEGYFL